MINKMHKSILLLLIALLPMAVMGNGKATTIKGTILNADSGGVILRYQPWTSSKDIELKSTTDKNGSFNFTFNLEKPVEAFFQHGNQYTRMLIHPGDQTSLNVDFQNFDSTIRFSGSHSADYALMAHYVHAFSSVNPAEPVMLLVNSGPENSWHGKTASRKSVILTWKIIKPESPKKLITG
jgi:hypothetical protein